MGQGQRSRSLLRKKKRQVGSRQRQVALLSGSSRLIALIFLGVVIEHHVYCFRSELNKMVHESKTRTVLEEYRKNRNAKDAQVKKL